MKEMAPLGNNRFIRRIKIIPILNEGFNTNPWNKLQFYTIFIIRRCAISLLIIFGNGVLQIVASTLFCFMVKLNRTFYT